MVSPLLCSLRGMLVLLLLVLCVCFHVACVMYLHLTSVQVGLTDLLLHHSAQRLDSSVHRVGTDAAFSTDKTTEWQNRASGGCSLNSESSDTERKKKEYIDNEDTMGINNNLCVSGGC